MSPSPAAVAIVLAFPAPFLFPYLELRRLGFAARTMAETRKFSADVYAYFTADPNLWLWGPLAQAWPKSEGLLFPGLTIVALAALGAGRERVRKPPVLQLLEIVMAAIAIALLLGFSIRLPWIKITSLWRVMAVAAIGGGIGVAVSRDARDAARRLSMSPAGIFSAIVFFAVVMSFGPDIHAQGRTVLPTNLYAAFYAWVPGFDGVRVPARFATIATLGLAALAALGIASIDRRRRRAVAAIACVLILVEAFAVPIPINQNPTDYKQSGLAPLPSSVARG